MIMQGCYQTITSTVITNYHLCTRVSNQSDDGILLNGRRDYSVSDDLSNANTTDRVHSELLLKLATMDPDCAWLQRANAKLIFIVVEITVADDPHQHALWRSEVIKQVWRKCSEDEVPAVGDVDEA